MAGKIEFHYHKVIDLKGYFIFESNGFWVYTFGRKQFVLNTEVGGVSRIVYDRRTFWGFSQASPNKYRIELKNGQNLEFCIAHKEEDAYQASINRLQRKIYGHNRLGVALVSKIKSVEAKTRRQQDKQFAKDMPPREFTLEKAIAAVLRRCAIELNDQTEYENPQAEKAKLNFAPVWDENIYRELAKFISNGDENVLSEVFTHVERWEEYAQNDGLLRGVNESTHRDDIRWFAMLDTLEKYGYTEAAKVNESVEKIALCLDRVKNKLNVTLDTAPALDMLDGNEEIKTLETSRLLELIGLTLAEQHWDLCNIDIGDDSYALCLLPHKAYKQCEKLLQGTKFSLSPF